LLFLLKYCLQYSNVLHFVNDSAAVTRNYESDAHSDDSEGEID